MFVINVMQEYFVRVASSKVEAESGRRRGGIEAESGRRRGGIEAASRSEG